jgi:hypothetical protein
MKWPALSPDLNPVENMWATMSRTVYQNGKVFDTIIDLENAIKESWTNITMDYITDLIDSMKNRIYKVILSHGKHSGY